MPPRTEAAFPLCTATDSRCLWTVAHQTPRQSCIRDGGVGANPGVTPAGGSEGALTVGLGGLPEPGQRDEHGP